MKNSLYSSLFFFLSVLLLSSCSEELGKQLTPTPTAFGQVNQIVVVADKDLWEGAVGDTFRYYFASAYPILPQPEPIFDLKHFTPQQLLDDPLRKELRNYVFLADLQDSNSAATELVMKDIGNENAMQAKTGDGRRTRVGLNKWAQGQLLIYMFAYGPNELSKSIVSNFPAAAQRVHKANLKQIEANVYQGGENQKLKEELRGSFGIEMEVPDDYSLAINDGETIWMRKETDFSSSNIMIRKIPYTDKSQLSKEGIKTIRDSLGRKYVSSEEENSFMKVNDVDLPLITKNIEIEDYYVLEGRGIWELENDFMGGPFITYLIHKPGSQELVFVDGFVHAPGKSKRKYMQNLELVMSSIRIR